jgi:hypothetical protein
MNVSRRPSTRIVVEGAHRDDPETTSLVERGIVDPQTLQNQCA